MQIRCMDATSFEAPKPNAFIKEINGRLESLDTGKTLLQS